MREETSYGIIPCQWRKDHWEVFLVQLHAGHWGFPKGHGESQETPYETATRELFEETKLKPSRLLHDQLLGESYQFKHQNVLIFKKVLYYIAEVEGVASIQKDEVKEGGWVPLDQIIDKVTFPEAKKIAKMVIEILSKQQETS